MICLVIFVSRVGTCYVGTTTQTLTDDICTCLNFMSTLFSKSDEMNEVDLLLKYPLISCEVRDGCKYYAGKVFCGSGDIYLEITETTSGNYKLETLLTREINASVGDLKLTSITDFLDQTVAIISNNLKSPKNLCDAYRRVLHEYSEFTRFHFNIKNSHVAPDLSKIVVSSVDESRREHRLDVSVDFTETKEIFKPEQFPFPEQLCKDLAPKFSNLGDIYGKFIKAIETLQPFFNIMDELDAGCCVIDPEKPTRRDCYRRIWLILVVVDPVNVQARPELRFLGPEHVTEQYLHKYEQSLEQWDDGDVIQGILNVLGLESFPVRPNKACDVLLDVGECSICFALRFNDKLPEVVCANKSCELVYHMECLYEWLSSVNSKRIFNQIQGQCPNCEKRISCPLPSSDVVT